ncbi:class I SAM-dependent methyltransferase [Pseudomonas chlororaphis]|uniref:class I SAM-dependent methyltransferase n=1 Tax=Pseudomonas chlororaphis TaxID=587753 RepID=UPI0009C00349|nr:class I SAM-dependent methyltransferase [Pseudomonas chlororaphis]AZD03677.1 Putative glycosyltransferase [Pseudomonas chlororaphis subsp. chlororaphis]MBM0285296.1 methyltransferase domain-containing protein [Pseudomonas chlororaphis]MDO1503484.1 methyltransferase domain-containing protein [Pseudomonas chlororaphis]ORM46933.1 hypothetical protein B6D51_20880 [Pseudomonas chlororaphis subsp. chlororaphis]TWR96880.1 methyltransferase domain-containing protein [Pseudomonas chlororaphis subsp.
MVTKNIGSGYNYADQYNDFWSRSDRMGTDSYLDRNELVDSIIESVGYGKVLDLGCGEGRLVRALAEKGLDAFGLDISQIAIDRANAFMPGRFFCGSALELPFADQEFDTVISTDCLEHIHPDDVPHAIAEIRRVCKKHAYLQIATTQDRDGHWHLTVEGRDWWESSFFKKGFVRNPAYYKINSLDDLSTSHWQITILMDINPSWPNGNIASGALSSVTPESHAYLSLYKELSSYIRPGDVVFNWSEQYGEGASVIRALSDAASVSAFLAEDCEEQVWEKTSSLKRFNHADFEIECAREKGQVNSAIIEGYNASILQDKALYDALVPGGRLIVLETQVAQPSLSGAQQLPLSFIFESEGELSLLGVSYKYSTYLTSIDQPEKAFVTSIHGYSSPPNNLINFERDYINPWLPQNAVVNGIRTTNVELITDMCNNVLTDASKAYTADFGASLCIIGYRLLEDQEVSHDKLINYIAKIDDFSIHQTNVQNSHIFRWLISLSYLKSKLLLKSGDINGAEAEFKNLVKYDALQFSPTLGTKIVSAYIELGNIHCAKHDYEAAEVAWTKGMHEGARFLQADESEWIGNPELPIKGALYEATQIADLLNICTMSLRALKLYLSGHLPFNRIWEDASDSVFKINKKRFSLLEKQNTRLIAIESAYFAQANLLEERWDVMQSMENMIQQRDETTSHQGKMLEERWATIQSMENMIEQRDEAIAHQGKMLEERWAIMQSMENMIEQRDQVILEQTLSCEAVPTYADGNSLLSQENTTLKSLISQLVPGVEHDRLFSDIFMTHSEPVPFCDLALTHYLFTVKLYEAARESGTRDLFFFAREGQPLKQMFDIYQATKNTDEVIRTHYLQVSRRSTLLLSLGDIHEETFETLFRQYRRLSISDFLKSLVLEEHGPRLAQALGLASNEFDAVAEDLPTSPVFKKLLQLKDFKDLYEQERNARSNAFIDYIKTLLGGDFQEEIHVVDVGWKGSIQDNLFNWFKRVRGDAAKVQGYYLGLVAPGNLNAQNKKTGLVFSNIDHLTAGYYVFNENRSLFEIILHADHGSAQKYIRDSEQNVIVVQDPFHEQQMIENKILPVSKKIMQAFEKIVAILVVAPITNEQLMKLAIKRHSRMVFEPTESEIDWLLSLTHRENFGVFEESQFVVSTKKSTLKERLEFTQNLLQRRRPSELGFWPWLTIRTKAVSGLSTVYKLFRLWKSR